MYFNFIFYVENYLIDNVYFILYVYKSKNVNPVIMFTSNGPCCLLCQKVVGLLCHGRHYQCLSAQN